MRITILLPFFVTAFWGSCATAEEILYYGNGWPISLVERACDGDEGCLTQLANCAPGTVGTCGTQVAVCRAYDTARAHTPELCVIDLRPDETGSFWRVIFSETLGFPDLAPTKDTSCGRDTDSELIVCFRLINGPVELEAWANLPIE